MKRIVLDTNVIVSALINPHGVPARIWQLVLAGEIQLCVDKKVLNEYYEVFKRPEFGFPVNDVNNILAFIDDGAEVVTALPLPKIASDGDDQIFVEVAVAAKAEYLVTGNPKHFGNLQKYGVRAVSTAQFISALRAA